ncbi:MAG: CDP-glucose 4,6-dehydratase [Verrucomicrobia bacterium]|nr:CDP-glucose 4,6-dehydratase [Verrucomicrobiota bacterium]
MPSIPNPGDAKRPRETFGGAFVGKKVFVTGHTGFKGAWLCEWLLALGAKVTGFSLPPNTKPALFEQLELARRVKHIEGDIRDAKILGRAVATAKPDFVFHLAAQSLVRLSYEQPVETYATNVMGTVHLLEALRGLKNPCAAILVTTDKCYENREWLYGYRENDPLGGHDPYSSSKAAAEIAIAAYRRSFFANHPVRLASVRAGNVIGGGDWAKDRIVPDCIRALQAGRTIAVRNKHATRPWQHVLEPLSGYLWLGAVLSKPSLAPAGIENCCSAFNFGPSLESNCNVARLVEEILRHWPGRWADQSNPKAVHEASLLNLATDKAHHLLGWKPVWNFSTTVEASVGWYRGVSTVPASKSGATARLLTQQLIAEYSARAAEAGLRWTKSA